MCTRDEMCWLGTCRTPPPRSTGLEEGTVDLAQNMHHLFTCLTLGNARFCEGVVHGNGYEVWSSVRVDLVGNVGLEG